MEIFGKGITNYQNKIFSVMTLLVDYCCINTIVALFSLANSYTEILIH